MDAPQDKAIPPIGGQFVVDPSRPMPGWGGGMDCYVATDLRSGRDDHMAVACRDGAPPRAQALGALTAMAVEGVLSPVAHGPALGPDRQAGWFVVSRAPPGPPLWGAHAPASGPWHEQDLLRDLLRPVAQALERLQARHLTHRAVRPDNMFRARAGEAVVLGGGWAAPGASLQPAVFEPPYVTMCLAEGRGEGSIADDVYALGVTLLVLASGRMPLEGLAADEVVRRKLELGSFAALVGDARLSPAIADLIRGMLAEDPEHRPAPVLLADPAAVRARRVAARPAPRAPRGLELGGVAAVNLRTLAFAIARAPADGVQQLRGGAVDRWLRRGLVDSTTAGLLDELVRARLADAAPEDEGADALLAMRAVAVLDPLAPLAWRGIALWPDGLGGALAAADAGRETVLGELVAREALAVWAGMRSDRADPVTGRVEAHRLRQMLRARAPAGGMARLRYGLNPLLACRSPLFARGRVVRMTDLLPGLEAVGARDGLPVDAEIGAFLAARQDGVAGEVLRIGEAREPAQAAMAALRLLAGLQARQRAGPLPRLAGWLAEMLAPVLEDFRHLPGREQRAEALRAAARAGALGTMRDLLDDAAARGRDAEGLAEAQRLVAAIGAELEALEAQDTAREAAARALGHEVALGVGLTALTLSLVAALAA